MPHGHPDYGSGAPITTIYSSLDMAELAARIGSCDVFDRRGNVIFIDDFEGSLAKYVTYADSGGSVALSNERARFGDLSCKLVTGDSEDDKAQIWYYQAFPVLSKMGIEFCWHTTADPRDVSFGFTLEAALAYWEAYVRWKPSTDLWEYWDTTGFWLKAGDAPPLGYSSGYKHFNFTKLVVDWVNKKYVRLIVNDTVYDLSGLGMWTDAAAAVPVLVANLSLYTPADATRTLFLDSLIITVNEP